MNHSRGLLAGICAYGLWGFLPLYWRLLGDIPAFEILCHRMFWSVFAVGALLRFSTGLKQAVRHLTDRKSFLLLLCSALLIGMNWFTYIWAVNSDMILETSLGYFINPLVTVVLGMLFFQERLRPLQYASVGCALIGVLYLTYQVGTLPIVALTLAGTFSAYTVIRKVVAVGSLDGLFIETLLLCGPALLLLISFEGSGSGHFVSSSLSVTLLLISAGPATAIPLVFFATAARNLPLSTVGLLQYSSPSIQFLIAIFLFNEPFSLQKLYAFCCIWVGLGLYSYDGLKQRRLLRSSLT
jgi:chloramphenicol-sensitive protein RarD